VGDAKRSGASGLDQGAVAQIFEVPVGSAGSSPKGADARFLFKVLDSIVPPIDPAAPETKRLHNGYQNALAEDILSAYLAKAGARIGAKINQAALQAATGAGF
jgi:hypothetical protein